LGHTRRYLIEFFGEAKALRDITPGDADEWRLHLRKAGLSDNTVRRRCGVAKQFFNAARRKGLIASNPFADLKGAVQGNPKREFFVTREMAEKVLAARPDAQWRLIFALCRYGGLRCVSEVLGLRWGDVHWDEGRMTVHSPKTEHHPGGESRLVPLFPELLPHLQAAFDQAEAGQEYCITRYRRSNQNLGTQFRRIILKAGLTPWPKLFQNLRSTRQTELADQFPLHVVCAWIGNSSPVAMEHYLQVTDEHFRQAVQNPVQPPSATPCPASPSAREEKVESAIGEPRRGEATAGECSHVNLVGPTVLSAKTSLS
jgi:integrase